MGGPLGPDKTIELGHHVLKAHIYKNAPTKQRNFSSRDMQAYWLCSSAQSLSAALVAQHNLFSPNVKVSPLYNLSLTLRSILSLVSLQVSRLLLLSGANPNTHTDFLHAAPVLCVACHEGYDSMVALLLEFGADPCQAAEDGMCALAYAAAKGHIHIIRALISHRALISQMDNSDQCPLVHAAIHGQLDAVSFLLQYDWPEGQRPTRNEALQQALVAAAAQGHRQVSHPGHEPAIDFVTKPLMKLYFMLQICDFLLSLTNAAGEGFDVNLKDTLKGETGLHLHYEFSSFSDLSANRPSSISFSFSPDPGLPLWPPGHCSFLD